MGVVDFLKKIGLLKTGSGSWSGNVQDQKATDILGDYYSDEKKNEAEEMAEEKKDESDMRH